MMRELGEAGWEQKSRESASIKIKEKLVVFFFFFSPTVAKGFLEGNRD